MAFYYVKNGGTATGDGGRYASAQTGSFAGLGGTGYYDSISAAIGATTTPVAGDFILVSDIHAFSSSTSQSYAGPTSGETFLILSVSDTAIDAAAATKGSETLTGGAADTTITGYISMKEINLVGTDNFVVSGGAHFCLSDSRIELSGTGDFLQAQADGAFISFRNTELAMNGTAATILISGGAGIEMYGGSVTTTTGGVTDLINGTSSSGGAHGSFVGVDLSAITGNLVDGMGSSGPNDDVIDFKFDSCKLASGVVFFNEAMESHNHRITVTRCSNVSAEAEYQYYTKTIAGEVQDDDVIRRADDEAFTDSATDISYKIVTNTKCGPSTPLWFDFPITKWSALSAGATDTLRFFVASTSALTDDEIWMEVVYPDGTTKELFNFASSRGFPLGGATLTTDAASDWRDGVSALAGHNEYQIDVSTASDPGADAYPTVRVYVAKPSVTIQLASEFDLN